MSLSPVQPVILQRMPLFGATEPDEASEITRKPMKGPPGPSRVYKRKTMPSVQDTFVYKGGLKTHVESLIDGGQIFSKVDTVLNMAKSNVLIDLYNFQSPKLYPEKFSPAGTPGADIQAQLVDKLIDLKRNRGVNVKVIIDNHWDPEFKEGHNDRTIAYLRENGIEVVTYPNFSKISHVKVLVVDNNYAVVGGMNWGNHSPTNHDAAVFIEGPDVRNIVDQVFRPDWVAAGRDAGELPAVSPFKPGRIKILQTTSKESPDGAKDEIFREILHQIATAKESIHAELFVLTQSHIVDALLFAHKRLRGAGKEGVKILVDPGLFFSFPGVRSQVQKLARAGVPIRFFESNREKEEKLHAKWAVFDRRRVLIGSANWSNMGLLSNGDDQAKEGEAKQRVSRSNHEIALLIDSPKLGRTFANQATWDFKNASFPILEFRDGRWRAIRPGSPEPAQSPPTPRKPFVAMA